MFTFLQKTFQAFLATFLVVMMTALVLIALNIKDQENERRKGNFTLSANEMRAITTLTPERFHLSLNWIAHAAYTSDLGKAGARFAIASTSLSDPVLCALDAQGNEHLFFAYVRFMQTRFGPKLDTTALHPILDNPVPGLCTKSIEQIYEQARERTNLPQPQR